MKFAHFKKLDTARPDTPLYVNMARVDYVAPLVSGKGSVLVFAGGESVQVEQDYEEITRRLFNMGLGQ